MARILGTIEQQAGGRILGTIKPTALPSSTLNSYSDVPVLGQLSNFGIGVGSAISRLPFGVAEAAMRATTGLGKLVGADTTYSEKYAEGIKKAREAIYEKPFKKSLETTSGQAGTITGNILPYFAGAGVVNPITKGLPIASKVLARTLPDIAISAAQSGGDLKTTGVTGVTSAVSNLIFPGSGKVVATAKDVFKQIGKSTATGYVGDVSTGLAGLRGEEREGGKAFVPGLGTAIGFGLGSIGAGKEYFSEPAKVARFNILREKIKEETSELLSKTRGIQNKVQLGAKKGTDYAEIISEPVIFKGLKVENSKINPDEAISLLQDRADSVMDAKSEMLPFADKYSPKITRKNLRTEVYKKIEGKHLPAEETAIKQAIDTQINALPESFSVSELDGIRAKARIEARNAKGIQKRSSEFAAIENASRDMVFKATDNLPIETNGEFAKANNFIKNNLNTIEFLDKTLRGQIVKGGRLTKLGGRVVGGIVGSAGGFWASLVGQEIGARIGEILVNNQLGSSLKMRMVKNLTDNPQVLQDVEAILLKASNYKPPNLLKLPPGSEPGTIGRPFITPERIRPSGAMDTGQIKKYYEEQRMRNTLRLPEAKNIGDINQGRPIPILPKGQKEYVGKETAIGDYSPKAKPQNQRLPINRSQSNPIDIAKNAVNKNAISPKPTTPAPKSKLGKVLPPKILPKGSIDNAESKLFQEAKKYKSAEEFVKAQETPKTVSVWNKSKFSNDGAYADISVIRKEENITLYQGGKAGDGRQFWTPDKKYAEQFGNVKEKTGSFYKIDNGNRVADVYVEAPTKSQLTDIWKKSKGIGKLTPKPK